MAVFRRQRLGRCKGRARSRENRAAGNNTLLGMGMGNNALVGTGNNALVGTGNNALEGTNKENRDDKGDDRENRV